MDRALWVAMNGAKHTFMKQNSVAQNMANVLTPGYRSEVNVFRALPVFGDASPTRVFVTAQTAGYDDTAAQPQKTDNFLDVAITTKGWFVVQDADGRQALTRDGHFQMKPNGELQTKNGFALLDVDNKIVKIPPHFSALMIAKDGTLVVRPADGTPDQAVGKLLLAQPEKNHVARGQDGLFRTRDGSEVEPSDSVELLQGSLEGSNVNLISEMTAMVSAARQMDMQMKLLQSVEGNAKNAQRLIDFS